MDSAFSAVRKKSKTIVVAVALLSLVTFNLLTLTNNSVHAKAYGFLESIVLATAGIGVLQNSPTEVARHAVGALVSRNEQLVFRNQELLSENERAVSQKENLARQTLILVNATRNLIASTSSAREEVRRVAKGVLERATARLSKGAARSVTTLSGKAIPGVGAAVAVGATGLDLIDTCKMIKDMNYLAKSMDLPEAEESLFPCGISLPGW